MNKIRAVIIEDENPAAAFLKRSLLELRPEWEIILIPGIIDEAVDWFASHPHPELIFLDIHLMDGSSFRFIEEAHPTSMIIFVTAYDEYALKAFSVNSIDYLLKPIHKERLQEAIAKFERLSSVQQDGTPQRQQDRKLNNLIQQMAEPAKKRRTRFLVPLDEDFITVPVSEISYFYSENKITSAVTRTGKIYAIDFSLNKLEEELDSDRFFRVNRQFIVAADAVTKVEPYFLNKIRLYLDPPFSGAIQVSREKVASLKKWLNS